MKGYSGWSYSPYRPLIWDDTQIYICRVVPGETDICIEWLPGREKKYQVFFRERGAEMFIPAGNTEKCAYCLGGLNPETEYEFYVQAGAERSTVRLAQTGKGIGTTVNYLHPEDEAYAFSGRYLCSPSMVRHPDGYLLAAMDVFEGKSPQNLNLIFRSDDDGATWHYVSELMPSFWGKLFIHNGALYMLSCSTEYGDLLIGKSTDGGKTFSAPVTLLRGGNGKNGSDGVHKNPQNMVVYNGRLYGTLEWGAWANKKFCHAAMVMSCDIHDDLLVPENWHFTPPLKFDHFAPELCDLPKCTMTIEGTLTTAPDGRLLNIMRFGKYGHVIAYEVNTQDPDAPLTYYGIIEFPANFSKFMIKRDPFSGKYYSIVCRLYDREKAGARNYQTLMVSEDLFHWTDAAVLYDFRDQDPKKVGLQYVDFSFEGEDIIYLCRTAINNAHNFHDSNYITFHRIKNFRKLTQRQEKVT